MGSFQTKTMCPEGWLSSECGGVSKGGSSDPVGMWVGEGRVGKRDGGWGPEDRNGVCARRGSGRAC